MIHYCLFMKNVQILKCEEIIRPMDRMFSAAGYEETYEWALRLMQEYPNCNMHYLADCGNA